jgi:hypothetical protein
LPNDTASHTGRHEFSAASKSETLLDCNGNALEIVFKLSTNLNISHTLTLLRFQKSTKQYFSSAYHHTYVACKSNFVPTVRHVTDVRKPNSYEVIRFDSTTCQSVAYLHKICEYRNPIQKQVYSN